MTDTKKQLEGLNRQFEDLKLYVNDLVNVLYESKSVDTDEKYTLLSNRIGVTSSWVSNESVISRLSSTLTKNSNSHSDNVLFDLNNGTAKLTHFQSGAIKYEDLSSRTSLFFSGKETRTVSLQEESGKSIVLDDDHLKKFLDVLQVSENLDSMKSIVNTSSDKLSKLHSSKIEADKLLERLSVENILSKIQEGRKDNIKNENNFGIK